MKSCNARIQPNLGELAQALKERLSDSNKNIAATVLAQIGTAPSIHHYNPLEAFSCRLSWIGLIAEAMGQPFKRQLPLFLPAILANLADAKV